MSSIDSLVGTVLSVDDVPAGGTTMSDHPAGATVLHLVDAGDFSEDGGLAVVAGTVVAYTSADLSADTLTLAEPLPVPVAEDAEVHVSPPAVSRVAVLRLDDANTLDARVPQALLDQVPVGLRGDDAETITVDLVDGQWQVVDLVAVPSRAMDRDAVEQIVMDTADGLTQHSMRLVDGAPAPLPDQPTTEGRAEGDTHHELTSGTGVVRAAYVLSADGQWVPHRFGDEVLDSVAAGKILGGVITALLRLEAQGELVVGSEDQVHVRIRDGRVDVMRPGEGDAPAEPYISMGKGADGAFRVLDEAGVAGGIMPDGSYEGPEVRARRIMLDGADLRTELDSGARIITVESHTPITEYYNAPFGHYELSIPGTIKPNTLYEIEAQGRLQTTGSLVVFGMHGNASTSGALPAAPQIGDGFPGVAGFLNGEVSVVNDTGGWVTTPAMRWYYWTGLNNVRLRTLLYCNPNPSGGNASSARLRDFVYAVRDLGYSLGDPIGQPSLGGGGNVAAPTPPPSRPPLTRTSRTFDIGADRALYNALNGYRATGPHTGYIATGRSPNLLYRTWIALPAAVRSYIDTLEQYDAAEVFLRVDDAYTTASVQPFFGTSSATSFPNTEPPWGNRGQGSRAYSKKATSGWTTMPAAVKTALATHGMLVVDYVGTSQGFMRWRRDARIRISGSTRT